MVATRSIRAWIMAMRPATWSAAFVPVLVGSAVAYHEGGFRWDAALAALLGALLIQIGTNFANDVFDFEQGADTRERLGPPRAVALGLLAAGEVRVGMWVAFFLATLAGLYLVAVAGPLVIAIGVASIASGIAYTKGKKSLAYLGLGDPFVLVFFGWVAVGGTAFVESGRVSMLALVAGTAIGALATAILVVNNVRDRIGDSLAAKRTLVVRFGRRAAIAEYAGLFAIAYAAPIALAIGWVVSPIVLLPLVTAPFGIALVRELASRDGRALNATLAKTSMHLVAFGVLFAIGIFAG